MTDPVHLPSMTSITYHPERRNDVLHDLSILSICGQTVHKLETLGTVFIDNIKAFNVFRRYNNVYEILLESDDHTIHFHRNYYVLESLRRLLGSQMDHLEVVAAYSYRHHGALISPEAFHLSTLRWDELHHTWSGASIYLETRPSQEHQEQWASPIRAPSEESEESEESEPSEESEEEEQQDPWASPSPSPLPALPAEVPAAPIKQAQPSAFQGLPSVRRCLSDRFTALLQKRTFSEVSESEEGSEAESDSEESDAESQEDTCMILRNGTRYPRNLY